MYSVSIGISSTHTFYSGKETSYAQLYSVQSNYISNAVNLDTTLTAGLDSDLDSDLGL